jgi:hypothetical protein
MRQILSVFAVLMVVAGVVFAADGTPAAVKPAKPAPAVAPAPAAITWYGMAMLRLREEIITNARTGGSSEESATYSNQIGYKIGAKVKPNDAVSLQFELGNDWYGIEEVKGIPGNYLGKRNPLTPWFSLAFVQWDPGYMHIIAGIIPVKGTALMDMLGVSIVYNKIYARAAHLQWGVLTNFSQTGLRIGAPILKDGFKLGVDLMSAVIEQRPAILGIDSMNLNASAVEFLLEAPMSCCAFTATPQVFVIPDRSYNKMTEKGDMELGVGADFGYKLSEAVSFRAGVAYAQNSNENSYGPNDTVLSDPFNTGSSKTRDTVMYKRSGVNVTLGGSARLGPGKFDADVNLSTDKNAQNANIDDQYVFVDLKYGWLLNKNFILMPRVRLFISMPKTGYDSKLTTRPELIFNGTF